MEKLQNGNNKSSAYELNTICDSYLETRGGVNTHLFDLSPDCIKIFDLAGNIVKMNPGSMGVLELDHIDQLVGKNWVDLWPDESKSTIANTLASVREGEQVQFDAFCPTAKGNPRWWNVVATPMRDSDGKIYGVIGVSRDVKELHLARVAIQEEASRKDVFITVLAHELRNPLSATSIAAHILSSHVTSSERTAELGQVISRQTAHMTRLVEDLLDLSRIARGLIKFDFKPLQLANVIEEAIDQVRGVVTAKNQTLNFNDCSASCQVLGDHTRLVQVVGNLIGNAARYTPDGGLISVKLYRQGQYVTLLISDTGIGLTSEKIFELFKLYNQANTTSDRSSGLGLGLTLVREFIELHKGRIFASSEGEGKGSTFTVQIPMLADPNISTVVV